MRLKIINLPITLDRGYGKGIFLWIYTKSWIQTLGSHARARAQTKDTKI
jgi:hypothetical protein